MRASAGFFETSIDLLMTLVQTASVVKDLKGFDFVELMVAAVECPLEVDLRKGVDGFLIWYQCRSTTRGSLSSKPTE